MQNISLQPQDFENLRHALAQASFPHHALHAEDNTLLKRYMSDYRLQHLQDLASQQGSGSFECHGFQIIAHYWRPANPCGTTFVLHGYFDHSALYGHLFEHLLKQGQTVVCLDLPGHGLSSGDRVAIDSFAQYEAVFVTCVERCTDFPQPFNAIGQSTGGAIITRTLLSKYRANQDNPFAQVILLAPLVRPCQWLYSRILRTLVKRWVKQVSRNFQANSHDPEFLNFIEQREPLQNHYIPLNWVGAMQQWVRDFEHYDHCPWSLTVIQGDGDNTVDWRYNLPAITRKFPNTEVALINDAKHHLVNESAAYRVRIFQHIQLAK